MNIYRFTPNKTSALLFSLICVLTLAACAGGGGGGGGSTPGGKPNPPPAGPSLLNLQIIPDTNNATLIWNNPDMDIANISISYKNSTAANFEDPIIITDNPTIARNTTDVRKMIPGEMIPERSLTNNTIYTFRVALKFKGDDVNKSSIAEEITRLIGPNLDQDEYADADPRELDKDGDGVNDNLDVFPYDPTMSGFVVTNLTARPGNGNVTLSWNNPDADIASINISYKITGSNDVQYWDLITTPAKIITNEMNVQEIITGLTNGQSYTFNISLTLQNADAGREGEAVSDTATPDVFSVTDLTATPGNGNVTLSWNNPDANIASISISYQRDGSTLEEFPTITDSSKRGKRAMGVTQMIPGLTNEEYYNFTVDLTLEGDDTGREGEPLSIRVAIGPDLDGDELPDFMDDDIDGDNTLNTADVDDDGDGLIEIATAEQLNQIRYNLLGSSLNTSDGVAGDASGCGGLNDISECNGYELTQDISLAGYNGDNWEPIGICGNNTCSVGSELFNAVFDGNGYTISDLTITNPGGPYYNAAGLFAAILTPAELRNINIASARITVNGTNVGALVGYTNGGNITNSHVLDSTVNGTSNIGGLVGNGANALITSSSADIVSVSGVEDSVGGLVGSGGRAIIISSNATVRTVSGRNNIGGLIGWGNNAVITSSYSESESVSGNAIIGGLVGLGNNIAITSSYATGVVIDGFQDVGGLVGQGDNANIALSSADTMSTTGDFHVGALIGRGHMATITSSYAVSEDVSTIINRAGGLIGWGNDANIISSYAAVRTISGGGEIGGLVGRGLGTDITSSYAVVRTMSGTGLGGLVGWGNATTSVTASYWDTQSNGVTLTISNRDPDDSSAGKTTTQLQSPTDFAPGIYVDWEDDMCGGDDDSIAWDLGNSTQYPALNCTPGGADAQRP